MPEYKNPELGDADFNYPDIEALRSAVKSNPNWFSPETHALVSIEPVVDQAPVDTSNQQAA